MLKLRKLSWTLLAVLGLGLAVSCEEDKPTPEPTPEAPVITLNMTEIDAPKEGNTYAVEFSITNPIEGVSASIAVPEVQWISGVDTSIDGIVKFDVLANTVVETREATFTVSYEGAADASFVVRQAAGDPEAFVFSNLQAGIDAYTVEVAPADKQTPYIFFSSTLEYIEESGLQDDEALFQDDMEFFVLLADMYGYSLADVLQMYTLVGDQTLSSDGLSPKTDYVAYVYHINLETQERLSDIARCNIRTAEMELEQINFDVDFDIQGPIVTVTITPENYDGHYFWDGVPVLDYEAQYPDMELADYAISNWLSYVNLYLSYGIPLEELLALCPQGVFTNTLTNMNAETEYAFYVMAIDSETAYPISEPVIENVTTGSVETSDLVVDIEISEVGSTTAVVSYVASNDTDPYVATVIDQQTFNELGTTDEERMDYLVTYYYVSTFMGSLIDQNMSGLTPETDYYAIAFGFVGGVVNTDLYKAEFTTSEAVLAECTMSVEIGDYYDADAVIALDSYFAGYEGMAFVRMAASIEGQYTEYYYGVYEDDGATYSDMEWIGYLTQNYPKESLETLYVLDFDMPFIFVGVAKDAAGNYGPVCTQTFTLSRDQVSDPEDLLEWWYSDAQPRRQMIATDQMTKCEDFFGLKKADAPIVYERQNAVVDLNAPLTFREFKAIETNKFTEKTR